jgi:hypothetical protein
VWLFCSQDLDGSGRIRYTEFLAATIEAQGAISEERLAEAFDRLDSDDSGYIDAENLAEILGKDFPKEEIDGIIQEVVLTKDKRISYSEFLALWENKHEQDRDAQLKLLEDDDPGSFYSSDIDMMSFRGRSGSLRDESKSPDPEEMSEGAEARATFILDKHSTSKHVAFTETVLAITQDDIVEQKILDDEADLLEVAGTR